MANRGGGDDGNNGHWWDNQWNELPSEWGETEAVLFEKFLEADSALEHDRLAQALYDEAFFNFDLSPEDRHDIMETLKDHLWDEYGIDFDDVFDWEGYRDAYDSVAS